LNGKEFGSVSRLREFEASGNRVVGLGEDSFGVLDDLPSRGKFDVGECL
jgi:hypothetical protein